MTIKGVKNLFKNSKTLKLDEITNYSVSNQLPNKEFIAC